MGVDPNISDENGQTFPHIAARRYWYLDFGVLEDTLDSDPDMILKNRAGQIPFDGKHGWFWVYLPAFSGARNILKTWVNLHNALKFAVYADFESALKDLPSLDDQGPLEGNTVLHLAVKMKRVEVVKYLLTQNAQVNVCNDSGQTSFDLSIIGSQGVSLMLMLIEHGAALVSRYGKDGETALHRIVNEFRPFLVKEDQQSSLAYLQAVLEPKRTFTVDLNHRTESGRTALFYAVVRANFLAAEYLCLKGADPRIPQNDGTTALSVAVENGDLKMTQLLCNHGSSIDINTFQGPRGTPLHHALGWRCSLEVVQYLLRQGADPHALDQSGSNVIHLAVRRGDRKMIDFLIGLGVDYNLKNNVGRTPLMLYRVMAIFNRSEARDWPSVYTNLKHLVEQKEQLASTTGTSKSASPVAVNDY